MYKDAPKLCCITRQHYVCIFCLLETLIRHFNRSLDAKKEIEYEDKNN